MTATITPATEDGLSDQVRALEEELAGLDPAIEAAARAGDEAEVARLVTRGRMIPHQLTTKRADVLRARIATATATIAELGAVLAPARERAQAAQEAAVAARAASETAERRRLQAVGEAEFASINHGQAIQARADLQRQLAALLAPPVPAATQRDRPLRSPVFPHGR